MLTTPQNHLSCIIRFKEVWFQHAFDDPFIIIAIAMHCYCQHHHIYEGVPLLPASDDLALNGGRADGLPL